MHGGAGGSGGDGDVAGRKRDRRPRAALGPVGQRERSVVRVGDPAHQHQAQPQRALGALAALAVGGEAGTGVLDLEDHEAGARGDAHALGAAAVATAAAVGIRYSLRPIKRLTATARLVSADLAFPSAGLSRRAPVDDAQSNSEAGELTRAFNALLDAVETEFTARTASEHRMRHFLADASHELRTPLTSIRGYAELERMRTSRAGSETTSDAMARIEAEGNRMARLVDDLLTLARGDQGQALATSRVDLTALAREAVELTRAAYPNREINAAVEPGLVVFGDESALLRAIRNLLTNAAIHTDPHGPISLDARHHDDRAAVSIADDGPGMTDEQANHAFERFWRADDSRVRTTGGTGLGLAASEVVEDCC